MPREFASTVEYRRSGRTRERDQEITGLAEQQHGVVARRQLLALGLGESGVDRWLRAGRLHQLHEGVYALGHRLIPREGRWMAAVLASGPDAALSHRSAAALWGIRATSRSRIDVTVAHRSRSSTGIQRRLSVVPTDERVVEDGIPVTSVHRTIFDLADAEGVEGVLSMLREAEYLRRWDRLSLWHLLERYPGKRGSRNIRSALGRLTSEPPGRKREGLEERFSAFLRRHRLPLPCFNDWITLGGKRYCVDCHWTGTGQIVELDSWQGHGTRSAFRDDRGRDRKLRVAGYSVTRLTWAQLDDEPAEVAADLRALLTKPA